MTTKKVAYLILAHSSFDQLANLLGGIYNEDDLFCLHIDLKAPLHTHHGAILLSERYENIITIDSRICAWGGVSLLDATILGFVNACQSQRDWSHLVLLSESHLPLQDRATLKEFLAEDESYIQLRCFDQLGNRSQSDIKERLDYSYRELPGVGPFQEGHVDSQIVNSRIKSLAHGSQWIILSRNAVSQIITLYNEPEFSWIRTVLIPDEIYIHTIMRYLGKDVSGIKVKNTLTTFLANKRDGKAKGNMIFEEDDFIRAQCSGYLFIRKAPKQLPNSTRKFLESISNTSFIDSLKSISHSIGFLGRDLPCTRRIQINTVKSFVAKILSERLDCNVDDCRCKGLANTPLIDFRVSLARDEIGRVSLRVLSEDGVSFKFLIIEKIAKGQMPAPLSSANYRRSKARARVHGVALNYEISHAKDTCNGFATLFPNDSNSVEQFASTYSRFLSRMNNIV
jgi:hypothetical protein